jgi:ABC-type nitrate/sulfonate/bicarbonate transport system permease component
MAKGKIKLNPEVPVNRNPEWITAVQILILVLLMAWIQYAVTAGVINKIFLSSPAQIFETFVSMIKTGELWPHVSITLKEVALGYLIAVVLGVSLGILFVIFPIVEKLFSPFMAAIMAIPKTAIMPLLVVWFGIRFKSKVILVIVFCVFNILFNTVTGAKQTQSNYLKVARVFMATRMQTICKVILPSALPGIFNGLRVTAATAITGVLFAEMQASKLGLGFLINGAQSVLNTPLIFLVIIIVTILSVFFVSMINLFEYFICRRWSR